MNFKQNVDSCRASIAKKVHLVQDNNSVCFTTNWSFHWTQKSRNVQKCITSHIVPTVFSWTLIAVTYFVTVRAVGITSKSVYYRLYICPSLENRNANNNNKKTYPTNLPNMLRLLLLAVTFEDWTDSSTESITFTVWFSWFVMQHVRQVCDSVNAPNHKFGFVMHVPVLWNGVWVTNLSFHSKAGKYSWSTVQGHISYLEVYLPVCAALFLFLYNCTHTYLTVSTLLIQARKTCSSWVKRPPQNALWAIISAIIKSSSC